MKCKEVNRKTKEEGRRVALQYGDPEMVSRTLFTNNRNKHCPSSRVFKKRLLQLCWRPETDTLTGCKSLPA
ncbi:MAG: hypothetical protein ABSA18_05970 [Dehalococcoidia bacterium]|jgi:hypothetical protein